ncbi:MAG: tRNA pseudouridine(55) synthase TruB [Chlamydiae bacterium]|nr:tRNA pseudouridine(55) synthase TruB [Chlamydiota bacterium]
MSHCSLSGILLVNKAKGKTSFSLVSLLRKLTKVKKIGHSGTLDPFASGLMVMLIGSLYTKKSNDFINHDKEYLAQIQLGYTTDTFDTESEKKFVSNLKPSMQEIETAISVFQGKVWQTPPMYSAKKINGQPLYKLARQGIVIERKAVEVEIAIELLKYEYPFLDLKINCSKGTYIRSLANDLGQNLKCGGFLHSLIRTRSGPFKLQDAIDENSLSLNTNFLPWLKK